MSKRDLLSAILPGSEIKTGICYWSPDDAYGFEKWLDASRMDLKTRKKLVAQLTLYARHGLPKGNREKFRHVEGKICEIKPTSQIRLLGFEEGADFVIVCMDIKKANKLSPALIERAQRLWRQYHER